MPLAALDEVVAIASAVPSRPGGAISLVAQIAVSHPIMPSTELSTCVKIQNQGSLRSEARGSVYRQRLCARDGTHLVTSYTIRSVRSPMMVDVMRPKDWRQRHE